MSDQNSTGSFPPLKNSVQAAAIAKPPNDFLTQILEAALLAAGDVLSLERIGRLFEEAERPSEAELLAALARLKNSCLSRATELVEVASGWRLQVREDFAPWISRLWEEKPQKYSRAMLETLALIAYRQPITRGDIEEVRGVAVSAHIIKTLAEREWIKVVGQREVPGRPSLYATTRQFLDYFNLKSLEELPSLNELKSLEGYDQAGALEKRAEAETAPQLNLTQSDQAADTTLDPRELQVIGVAALVT